MRAASPLVLGLAATLASASAVAQPQPAPWGSPPVPSTGRSEPELPTPVAPRGGWPSTQGASLAPTLEPSVTPGITARGASSSDAVDPAYGHAFQMPNARVLREGDVMGHYVSHLGWVGARFGLTSRVDVGVGVPYYFLGLSLDARVAFVQRQGFSVAWWGYASVPFQPDGESATSSLGFTWSSAGMGWLTGPLVSLWGQRAGLHLGVHLAQRTGLGGVWLLAHATVEARLVSGVKVLGQVVSLYELSRETGDRERALLGNAQPRFLPYALGGLRLYTRHFAADFGVLVPIVPEAPLHNDRLPALPWVSLAHLF